MILPGSLRFVIVAAVLAASADSLSHGAVIPLFGSGTDSNNAVLPSGSADPHYTIQYGSFTGPAIVDGCHYAGTTVSAPGDWLPNQATAGWISSANSCDGFPAPALVYYSITFDLTGLDPKTVAIAIQWAADDSGSSGILLNGQPIPGSAAPRDSTSPGSEPWAHFTNVALSSAQQVFNPGINTLTFVQDGVDSVTNGIIVRMAGTAAQIGVTPVTPVINTNGVVPIFSPVPTIQPGSWVSIFGTNLSNGTASWDGSFPTSLNRTSVTINGKSAFLWYVSPGQLNIQAPDDTTTGPVQVVVNSDGGRATSTVTLAPFGPSFSVLDGKHVAGIIYRPDGSGAYGGGTYDILGPTGTSLGYPTRAAAAGDVVTLFCVGFGPTNPVPRSGEVLSTPGPVTTPVTVTINGVSVTPSFAGITEAGLYQLNLTIPVGAGTGDQLITGAAGGAQTQPGVFIPLR
jgi:uncharacterized protein (TIGR03437 family)